jgi:hypothetical protein
MKYRICNACGQRLLEAESADVTIDQFYIEATIADRWYDGSLYRGRTVAYIYQKSFQYSDIRASRSQ